MSDPAIVFLPWVARGGTLSLPPDRRDSHPASRVASTAKIVLNGTAPVSLGVQVMGPGDVAGLMYGQVIRTEPRDGTRTFEANYLAAVEFDEPALPWLFTPASASEARLRPWLCLVVVRVGAGIRLDVSANGTLPVLRIGSPALPEDELPDLADSWAWAHGQVVPEAPGDASAIAAALDGDPTRNLSRLVCGRLLAEQTEYLACVVPTFEAGRLAGLGQDPGDAQGPAWKHSSGMGPVELPVYHHWRFATGPAGDFQSLALAIRGRVPEPGFGSRAIGLDQSGIEIAHGEGVEVRLGGALRPIGVAPAEWSDPSLAPLFATALREAIDAPDKVPPSRPLLAPPRYGSAYRPDKAQAVSGAAGWYDELNADPANRMAAALGVQIVQRDQEVLVASAWDQAADMQAASAIGKLADAGTAFAERLHARHIARLAAEAGIFVVAPLLRRMSGRSLNTQPEVAALVASGFAATGLSATVRRVARVRGPAMRRAAAPATPASQPREGLATRVTQMIARRRANIDFGLLGTIVVIDPSHPSALADAWTLVRGEGFASAPRRPDFAVGPPLLRTSQPGTFAFDPDILHGGGTITGAPTRRTRVGRLGRGPRADGDPPDLPDPPVHPPRPPRPRDSAQAALLRALAPNHLAAFFAPAPPGLPTVGVINIAAAFAQIAALSRPRTTFANALDQVLAASPSTTAPASPSPSPTPAIPADLAPRFGAPMASALAELGQEWLLPGLDGVPTNSALALVTNSPFVQAFMIGLNHEFGRELLWREFPAPLDATFFQRFWDNAIDPGAPVDLLPLASRGDRALEDDGQPGDQFVLFLRSELLLRYPDAMVSAKKGGEVRLPQFTGALVPDARFFGFAIPESEAGDWSIEIAEQPGAPRFGFEVGEALAGVSHAPAQDATAAALAHRLRQLPARITIPVKVLMRQATP